jgi:hypothetical protein
MDPQKEISNYFPTLHPYRQENGEKGPIHVLIYPQIVLERDPENTGL